MRSLLGLVRTLLVGLLVLITFVGIGLAALLPVKIRGARPGLWVVVMATRLFNVIFNIHIECPEVDRLRGHRGFLFLNHLSFIEPLVLFSFMPCRFLAAVELRHRLFIGWMAEQVGTIFVTREDRASRREARRVIARVLARSTYPPVVVFPEGKLGLGDRINPFRYGIFKTAVESETPFLLCSLSYDHPEIAIWKGSQGERLLEAVWRLACFPGPLTVTLTPLELISPTAGSDPTALAHRAQRCIADALHLPTKLPKEPKR